MGYLTRKINKLDNGMEVLKLGRSVNFLLITADKKLILAEQPRAATNGELMLNLYGGMVDDSIEEQPLDAAYREMREELNLNNREDLKGVEIIYTDKNPSPGVMDEKNTLYFFYLKETSEKLKEKIKCNDESEAITAKFIDLEIAKEKSVSSLGLKTWVALQLVSTKEWGE